VLLFCWVIAMTACNDDPAKPAVVGPSLRIVASSALSDTISALPTQGLVVQVLNAAGRPDPGVEVRFEVVGDRMHVRGAGQSTFGAAGSAVTDAAGQASVGIRYGLIIGPAAIAVSVPTRSLADTARFTVLPGAATRLFLLPRDTVVNLGTSFTYRSATFDRAGNARADPVIHEAVGTAARVDPSGRSSAEAFGISRVRVRATVGSTILVDSGGVAVVSPVQVVWNDQSNLVLGELTGTVQRVIGPNGVNASWEPGGRRLVFIRLGALVIADLDAGETVLPTPAATVPEWSADGYIYFASARVESGPGGVRRYSEIMRIRPDGTGREVLAAAGGIANHPTASPDGRSLAFSSSSRIVVLDFSTNTTRGIAVEADAPHWSPDGQWIAFLRVPVPFGTYPDLMLVRPDGSDLHRIGDHGLLHTSGIEWSPDSRWIVGVEKHPTLVDVSSGRMVYLPFRVVGFRR
jgi:hypothetical protein